MYSSVPAKVQFTLDTWTDKDNACCWKKNIKQTHSRDPIFTAVASIRWTKLYCLTIENIFHNINICTNCHHYLLKSNNWRREYLIYWRTLNILHNNLVFVTLIWQPIHDKKMKLYHIALKILFLPDFSELIYPQGSASWKRIEKEKSTRIDSLSILTSGTGNI